VAYERIDTYGLFAGSFVPAAWWSPIGSNGRFPHLLLFVYFLAACGPIAAPPPTATGHHEVARLTDWQQAVLDSAEYSIISTDIDGLIVSFNAAAQRMLAIAPRK